MCWHDISLPPSSLTSVTSWTWETFLMSSQHKTLWTHPHNHPPNTQTYSEYGSPSHLCVFNITLHSSPPQFSSSPSPFSLPSSPLGLLFHCCSSFVHRQCVCPHQWRDKWYLKHTQGELVGHHPPSYHPPLSSPSPYPCRTLRFSSATVWRTRCLAGEASPHAGEC